MSRFRTAGGLDDPSVGDGDVGFVGMDMRRQAGQLEAGLVSESRNGRMDGYWQPRMGAELLSGALSVDAVPLRLPFWLADTTGGKAISAASLTGNVVSLTVTGHGFVRSSDTLEPTGANNDIEIAAVAGVSERVTVEIVSLATDVAETNVSVVGNSITITLGDKARMLISAPSDASVDGQEVFYQGEVFGEKIWATSGITDPLGIPGGDGILLRTDSSAACILEYYVSGAIDSAWANFSPGAWPNADTLTPYDGNAAGNVTFAANDSNGQQVVDAINGSAAASVLVTAANAAGNDGSGTADVAGPITVSWGDSSAWLEIKGLGFATTDPNGIKLVTPTDANTLTYPLTGANEVFTIGGGDDKVLSELTDGAVTAILGSCVFSDPASSNDEVIIIATNGVAKKVDLDAPYTVTDIAWPAGESLSEPVHMVQAFDRVMVFRDGARPWHWLPGGRPIESAELDTNVVTVVCRDHGLQAGDVVTISGVDFATTDPNGSRTVATVTDADTFTFALTAANETYTANTGKMVADFFTLAPAGSYTARQTFNIAGDDYTSVDGLVTFTVTGNTTIRAGDMIVVHATTVPELENLEGREYQVVFADGDTVQFYAPVIDHTGDVSESIDFGGRVSVGGGFMHQPGAPWGVYFQRRLWVPYFYEPGGTYDTPTYTDRETRDEIAASDILDCDTFDRIESQFRVTAGVADFLVGMHPFYEDALLVLMRNSLHLVVGTQGTLSDTVVKELTREVGCLARKSIASQGNAVFFLSDNGVYGVEFIEGYNLRGISEPMSKPIQPLIDRINRDLAGEAVGIYFNNRYYLAVPLDSVPGRGDAAGNNSVLVFNMLNRGWESIDTFGEGNFDIMDFHVARAGERNDLYAVNATGGVHRLESRNEPVDTLSFDSLGGSTTHAIDYSLATRGYTFGTAERKRFTRAQVQMQSDTSASDVIFEFDSEDPDSGTVDAGSVSSLLGDELAPQDSANLRMRLGGVRGYSGKLTISANLLGSAPVGRPKIQSVMVEGTVTNRATISQH